MDSPSYPHPTDFPTLIDWDLHCRECGYSLRGLCYSGACPECGQIIAGLSRSGKHTAEPSYSGWACLAFWILLAGWIVLVVADKNGLSATSSSPAAGGAVWVLEIELLFPKILLVTELLALLLWRSYRHRMMAWPALVVTLFFYALTTTG